MTEFRKIEIERGKRRGDKGKEKTTEKVEIQIYNNKEREREDG